MDYYHSVQVDPAPGDDHPVEQMDRLLVGVVTVRGQLPYAVHFLMGNMPFLIENPYHLPLTCQENPLVPLEGEAARPYQQHHGLAMPFCPRLAAEALLRTAVVWAWS